MAAITKTRKLEKRPKTKKFPFSRPGTKLYPTNSKRVYSRTVTLFSTCKVFYQFSFRFSSRFRDLDQSKIFPTNFFFICFSGAPVTIPGPSYDCHRCSAAFVPTTT